MKLNKTNLIWALSLPGLVIAGLFVGDRLLQTEFLLWPLLLVYFEHVLIGWLLGLDLGRDAGSGIGGVFSLPLNLPVLAATAIFDYLLVAFVIYVLLSILTKHDFPAGNLR